MGGKSSTARQFLYILATALMVAYGCQVAKEPPPPPLVIPEPAAPAAAPEAPKPIEIPVPKEVRERRQAEEHLLYAQSLLSKGDYEGAFRENQKVVALVKDQPPSDAAIFNMGLIYAHPKNPKKDNKRAIGFFNRVVRGFPDSPWLEQAKIWVGVLDGVEKLKQVDLEIEEKKRDRAR